jgi:hypothetical protein
MQTFVMRTLVQDPEYTLCRTADANMYSPVQGLLMAAHGGPVKGLLMWSCERATHVLRNGPVQGLLYDLVQGPTCIVLCKGCSYNGPVEGLLM